MSLDELWVNLPSGLQLSRYQVSSEGRVRNKQTRHELQPSTTRSRYYVVPLYTDDGERKTFKVHFLICSSFHGLKPDRKLVVDHSDRNPLNNKASNLRWVTYKENAKNRENGGKTRSMSGTAPNASVDLSDEIWVKIKNTQVQVSNCGRVKWIGQVKWMERSRLEPRLTWGSRRKNGYRIRD